MAQKCPKCGWSGPLEKLRLDCWQDAMVCPVCKNKHVEMARAGIQRCLMQEKDRDFDECIEVLRAGERIAALEAENARLRAVAEAAEELLIEYDPDEDRGAYQIKAGALTALRKALEGLSKQGG